MKFLLKQLVNTIKDKLSGNACYGLALIVTSLYASEAANATPAQLAQTDIAVLDVGLGSDVGPEIVFKIDPANGSRSVVKRLRDLDPADLLHAVNGIALDRSRNILVIDSLYGIDDIPALFWLDNITLEQTRLVPLNLPNKDPKRKITDTIDLAVENSGSVLVLVATSQFGGPAGRLTRPSMLYRVEPKTGAATLLSDFAQISGNDPDTGPIMVGRAVTVAPSGFPVVAIAAQSPNPPGESLLYRIDPNDGTPTLLAPFPDEVNNSGIWDIQAEPSGSILATADYVGDSRGKLYRFNQSTGQFKVLSDFSDGPFKTHGYSPAGIAVGSSGKIWVADGEASPTSDNQKGMVWQIDPKTGDRSMLSDFGLAPQGDNPYYISAAPKPLVEFKEINSTIELNGEHHPDKSGVWIRSDFSLGKESNGINPLKEPFDLTVGSITITLPAGFFKVPVNLPETFQFHKEINHIGYDIVLEHIKAKDYRLKLHERGKKWQVKDYSLPISITIGDDQSNGIANIYH